MIKNGAFDLNYGLECALNPMIKSHDITIIRLLLDSGATNLNHALQSVCASKVWKMRHYNRGIVIKELIERGASNLNNGLNTIIRSTLDNKYLELKIRQHIFCDIKYLVNRGATNIDGILSIICYHMTTVNNPHQEMIGFYKALVNFMIDHGATQCRNCRKTMQEHKFV
jgi:hypothetical protein